MSERILVTGAGGYLGRHVLAAVRGAGLGAIAVLRQHREAANVGKETICELSNRDDVETLFAETKPDAIIHCAAWIGAGAGDGHTLSRAISDNVVATANIVAASARMGTKRLVLCSSAEVYGAIPCNGTSHTEGDVLAPEGLYGKTKQAAEFAVLNLTGSVTAPIILRMPGLHGQPRHDGIVARLMAAAMSGNIVELAEPDTRLSFLWVEDAARIAVAAARSQLSDAGTIMNVANSALSLRELASAVEKKAGRPVQLRAGAAPPRNRTLDTARMRRAVPFEVRPFEDGLVAVNASVAGS